MNNIWQRTIEAPAAVEAMFRDLHPLAAQLGSAAGLSAASSSAAAALLPPKVHDRVSLREFLERYRAQILLPIELPTILRTYNHANQFEVREVIKLDKDLQAEPALARFSGASRFAGLNQLRNLRPLRDQRLIHRYLSAVESEEANGWHTIVYGIILSIYSIPLRQGLMHYTHETIKGFVQSAAIHLQLSDEHVEQIVVLIEGCVPKEIELLLGESARHRGIS